MRSWVGQSRVVACHMAGLVGAGSDRLHTACVVEDQAGRRVSTGAVQLGTHHQGH